MVRIFELEDRGDQRGSSYTLPEKQFRFLGSVVDVHFSTTLPGHIRGNHFHRLRKEVLVVRHEDSWTLASTAKERPWKFESSQAPVLLWSRSNPWPRMR